MAGIRIQGQAWRREADAAAGGALSLPAGLADVVSSVLSDRNARRHRGARLRNLVSQADSKTAGR